MTGFGGEPHRAGGIAYRVRGRGPVLLLVHGWGCTLDVFAPLAEELARQHRLVAVDLRGHGASHGPDPASAAYSVSAFADDVAAVLDDLDVAASTVAAAGHSLGGAVALELGVRRRVRAVVMLDPAVSVDGTNREHLLALAARVREDRDGGVRREYAAGVFSGVPEPLLTELVGGFAAQPPEISAATARAIAEYDGAEAIEAVDVPVTWIAPTGRVPHLAERVGLRIVEAEDAGHFVHLERPEWTLRSISGAL